jgi:hypothetical protein
MPLPIPNLDDRTFDQLVTEARALIPRYLPAWTDYNPSDPGITLLELFASLFEAAIYQINRVPERSLEHFAALVGVLRQIDPASDPASARPESIEQTLHRALEALAETNRAITAADIEFLVIEFLVTKAFFSAQPTLQHHHQANVPAVLIETLPDITALDQAAVVGDTALVVVSVANLKADDMAMIDDGAKTEFVQLVSLHPGTGAVTVTISSPLRFDHAQGVKLTKILGPISETATVLAAPAKTGDSLVVLEPLAQLIITGVLQLDTGTFTEYIRIQLQQALAGRAKAVVEVVADTPNVFPDEQLTKVIIVPNEPDPKPIPCDVLRQLHQHVFAFLRQRCLITTRVRVVPSAYTPVNVAVTVVRDFSGRVSSQKVEEAIRESIKAFLSPLTGGVDGTGWEFGRAVFRSELYQLIEGIAGVDHVRQLLLNGDEIKPELPLSSSTSLIFLQEVLVTVVNT